jgi:hypothetical protein
MPLPQEQEVFKREIESTDREIDQLVYELYGLSEDEIRIVEGQARSINDKHTQTRRGWQGCGDEGSWVLQESTP